MEHLLAIDNGTQSVRTLLFDLQGRLIAKAQEPLKAGFSAQPGWAEYPVEDYWRALCSACQRLWLHCPVPKDSIKGVAVTTQRGTVINLDRHGQPLRAAMVLSLIHISEPTRPY